MVQELHEFIGYHVSYVFSYNSNAEMLFIACFPVYRTYVRPQAGEVSAADARTISETIEKAKANCADLDGDLFDFFRDILLLRVRGEFESELVMRFQQLTGPVMAKGWKTPLFTASTGWYR